MEDEDALVDAVVVARAAMAQEMGIVATDTSGDAAKDTLAFMSQKEPLAWSSNQKVTLNHMKKALRDAKKIMEKRIIEEAQEPEVEEVRECTVRAIDANGGQVPDRPFDTCAVECKVGGRGIVEAATRLPAEFIIEAFDHTGHRREEGGDAFFVAIRGASRVRARVHDNADGTYRVEWKPAQSGNYAIAVSYFGVALQGSPFKLHATEPIAYAPNCLVRGDALTSAIARLQHSFYVHFKDRLGNQAHAVDLDVYVEPMPISGMAAGTVNKSNDKDTKAAEGVPAEEDSDRGKKSKRDGGKGGGRRGGARGGDSVTARDQVAPSQLPPPPVEVATMPPLSPNLDGGESADEVEIEGGAPGTSAVTRNRTIRVKIGGVPLVMRAREDLDSDIVGQLLPGQMVTVIREKVTAGKVRAMIALESISRMPEAVSNGDLWSSSNPPSPTGSATGRATEAGFSTQSLLEAPTGSSSSGQFEDVAESAIEATGSGMDGAGADSSGGASEGATGGMPSVFPAGSMESLSHEEIAATIAKDGVDGLADKVAWVTLVKDGRKLVTSRVRQSAGSRQQHQQQWRRRMANDQSHKLAGQHKLPSVSLELSSDPTGIGFAFGGIHPGTLHARGSLFESHSVSYSIGLVGRYLLHVRLRQQAVALPGSPFQLNVKPGKAHALSSKLPKGLISGTVGMTPETGCGVTVHTADIMGNQCIAGGADVKGDCFEVRGKEGLVTSTVKDNGDGSYYLHWNSNQSGVFNVGIKIFNEHIVGSPTQIKLKSTTPDLSKSELSGEGLHHAIAGKDSKFYIKFYDQYGNAALPGETSQFGLALLKAGEKNKEAKVHEHTMMCIDEDNGRYEITFTATKDGTFDLHVWSEDQQGLAGKVGDRLPFPNSPFHCVVQAGAASPSRSYVDGWIKESRAVDKHGKAVQQETNSIIAGDSVIVRPQICDDLDNAAALPEGALDVNIIFPDGTSHDLTSSSLKFTMQSKGGITTYDIRHDAIHAGVHAVHLRLAGVEITGSPVKFNIETATAEVKMCKLTPPPETTLYSSNVYTVVLKTFDRFGNPMAVGGLQVAARLQLIKSGVHDLTTLMPNNNTVEIVDYNDGSYGVQVSLIKIAATVKVIVNMDKNIPAGGGELPPVQLTFVSTEDGASSMPAVAAPVEEEPALEEEAAQLGEAGLKLQRAGQEVMEMMSVGLQDPGVKPKAAIAVAVDAFASAAAKAKSKPKK